MESMPRVSVLIPVHNTKEEHLRAAIDSVIAQTFSDFELIIVNDASTDPDVERVVLSYTDSRIRYFANPENLGISGTRNRLIDLARGEYLAVMDHDDISLPGRFEKEVVYLDAHPGVGVVSCAFEMMRGGRSSLKTNPETDAAIKLALFEKCAVLHPASMIRKSVLEKTGLRYEEQFSPAEDYGLWCRLIPHTQFHNLPEALFRYRSHRDNTSSVQSEKMEWATLAVQHMLKTDNPVFYDKVMKTSKRVTAVKLFGFLPGLTIVRRGKRCKASFFGIPLFRSKIKYEL